MTLDDHGMATLTSVRAAGRALDAWFDAHGGPGNLAASYDFSPSEREELNALMEQMAIASAEWRKVRGI